MDIKKIAPWNWFAKEEENACKPAHLKRMGDHDFSTGNPFHPFHLFHQEVDRLVNNVFRGFGLWADTWGEAPVPRTTTGMLKPTVDIRATDKAYTITVEVPGVHEKDVALELVDDTLTIRGEKKQEKEETSGNFHRVERVYGQFQRVLSLPLDADQEKIEANFQKGVLTIVVPRKPEEKRDVRRIRIGSGQ